MLYVKSLFGISARSSQADPNVAYISITVEGVSGGLDGAQVGHTGNRTVTSVKSFVDSFATLYFSLTMIICWCRRATILKAQTTTPR
jgi:hypothetical protein